VGAGVAGALATLLLMGIAWSRRLRGVRRPLVNMKRIATGGER
jgi:hypothetical protein